MIVGHRMRLLGDDATALNFLRFYDSQLYCSMNMYYYCCDNRLDIHFNINRIIKYPTSQKVVEPRGDKAQLTIRSRKLSLFEALTCRSFFSDRHIGLPKLIFPTSYVPTRQPLPYPRFLHYSS